MNLLSLKDLSSKEILSIISLAQTIKKSPKKYSNKLKNKTLLMLFAKPSLRTRLSFEMAMQQLGGNAIFFDISTSSIGKKESIKDASKVMSRYVSAIMARLYEQKNLEELAKHSSVPVINGLTNSFHPCQILGDLLTIKEKFKSFKDTKITFVGDANNNVTHSLIIACNKLGIKLTVSSPNKKQFLPNKKIINNFKYKYEKSPKKAVKNATIIYTDSWMSYHIPKSEKEERKKILKPYKVNQKMLSYSKKALFMHCLPAKRGLEVTSKVLDSKRSIIYDQAENRMHIQKAILLKLL